ncbi:hypothetical protein AMTRI_Chr03g48380 [Amborella trichopoda]
MRITTFGMQMISEEDYDIWEPDDISTTPTDDIPTTPTGYCCTICMSELSADDDDLMAMPCGHFYHEEYIFKWLEGSDSCPFLPRRLKLLFFFFSSHINHLLFIWR